MRSFFSDSLDFTNLDYYCVEEARNTCGQWGSAIYKMFVLKTVQSMCLPPFKFLDKIRDLNWKYFSSRISRVLLKTSRFLNRGVRVFNNFCVRLSMSMCDDPLQSFTSISEVSKREYILSCFVFGESPWLGLMRVVSSTTVPWGIWIKISP